MLGLRYYLLLVTAISLAFASDLKGSLTSAGISAVFPGDAGYASASSACESSTRTAQ